MKILSKREQERLEGKEKRGAWEVSTVPSKIG